MKTKRDEIVYDWNRQRLAVRMKSFISAYNAEVYRHGVDPNAGWPESLKWSRDLKLDALQGKLGKYADRQIRLSLYRAFTRKWLFFDRIFNEECTNVSRVRKSNPRNRLLHRLPDAFLGPDDGLHSQLRAWWPTRTVFPLSHLTDLALIQFRQRYSDESITKEDSLHYIYALLYDPDYRERNIKSKESQIQTARMIRAT